MNKYNSNLIDMQVFAVKFLEGYVQRTCSTSLQRQPNAGAEKDTAFLGEP